ncbi:MAG TPA: hypothetical protein VFP50_00160 [Anaeromyxobacteraceae bacterium]|nr:hypothetical protein [Anaeromyxobacteraceae bacterium]
MTVRAAPLEAHLRLEALRLAPPDFSAPDLSAPDLSAPDLAPGPAFAEGGPGAAAPGSQEAPPTEAPPTGAAEKPSLDFDLLGVARPPPEPVDAGELRLRRRMLGLHQGLGLGLLSLQLATTVVGQLNYSDRFPAGPDTGRYRRPHQVLAYGTLGVFAVNGAIALLAPPSKAPKKLDRVMVHRIAMLTAAAGLATQAVLGIQTRERVGRLDQERRATIHLVVGYATLAAVLAGVGAIVL